MLFDSYKINTDHRNTAKSGKKSQWTITVWQELALFSTAQTRGWRSPEKDILWSVLHDDSGIRKIGTEPSGDLYIAKYCCDQQNQWHGYPVMSQQYDRPPSTVLKAWRVDGLISNSVANRWLQGKL